MSHQVEILGVTLDSTMTLDGQMAAKNAAARLTRQTKKRAHMTPVLRDFHWLPVVNCCQFKILLFT